jgi:hypothetical protein
MGLDTKKIVKICLPTPPSAESEREGVPQERARPACYNKSTAVRARQALALSFINKELAVRAIPDRIYTQKSCTSTCVRPQVSSLASDWVFGPAGTASKSCRPKSRNRRRNQGEQMFGKLFRPEPVIAQGQGRSPLRSHVPEEHSNRKLRPQGHKDRRGQACPLSRCARSSPPVLRFPCIRPYYATRGNKEGSCFLEKPLEQVDTKSSPSSLKELKFELDTRLTVSCVVAVALAYGLVSVSGVW